MVFFLGKHDFFLGKDDLLLGNLSETQRCQDLLHVCHVWTHVCQDLSKV
jgi:hypothetical protein